MQELNMMLADLADDGALDSSGVFTMSLEKAQEKLSAYRLADPGLFVLNLVASAVTSGATEFTVMTQENVTSFSFDCKADIDEEQLERLFSYILEPGAPAYLRELALAVHAALVMPGNPALSLLVSTRRMCQEMLFKDGQPQLMRAPVRAPGIVLQLDYPERNAWSRLFSRGDRRAEVVRHLFHFCRYAPLNMRNNGKPEGARLTLGVYDDAVFAWRHARGSQPLKVVGAERRFDLLISRKTTSPVASSMVIALMSETNNYQNEGLLIISRGVSFRRPQGLLGFPMAQAIVTADHLEKNLSQSDLVEDESYHALLEVLRGEVEDLIQELCLNPPPGWNSSTARLFSYALDDRYPGNAPLPVETFRRLSNLKASCRDSESLERQVAFWQKLTQSDAKAGQSFRKELLAACLSQAGRAVADGAWADALDLRRQVGVIEQRPVDSLTVVLMVLADQAEKARFLLEPQTQGYSPELAYLLGWLDDLEGEGDFSRFLRFQRAVESRDFASADALADSLEQAPNASVLLLLWLGWYAIARQRFDTACRVWDKAVGRLWVGDWQFWPTMMWNELSGKVSFANQVRWQVKRAFEELRHQISFPNPNAQGQPQGKERFLWASEVWHPYMQGETDKFRHRFHEGLFTSLISSSDFTLAPLEPKRTGFFH